MSANVAVDVADDVSEDCMILGDPDAKLPKPLKSTEEGLVKREMDVISGNKPFTETVGIGI